MYEVMNAHPLTVFTVVATVMVTPLYMLATYVFSGASARKGLLVGTVFLSWGAFMFWVCLSDVPRCLGLPMSRPLFVRMLTEAVRKTIHRFNKGGVAALADKPPPRPAAQKDRRVRGPLEGDGPDQPAGPGLSVHQLDAGAAGRAPGRRTKILLSSAHYLSQVMAENDIVYRRPKHGMAPLRDPQEYDEKKAFLEFVKKGRARRTRPSTCCTLMSVRFTSTRP